MRTGLRKLVNYFTPPGLYEDRYEQYRARLSVSTLLTLIVFFPLLATLNMIIAPAGSLSFNMMLFYNLPITAALLALLWWIRRSGRHLTAIHIVLALGYAGIFTAILVTGGPRYSPAVFALVIPPIVASVLSGLRGGVVWALICAGTLVLLVLGDFLGSPYRTLTPELSLPVQVLQLWIFVFLMGVGFSLLHAYGSQQLRRDLDTEHERYEHMATHDPLTGLANRMLFTEALQRAQYQCERYNSSFALLFLDLDGFKLINDNYGHNAGDAVLQEVAQRLNTAVRQGDMAARLGGDEFALLLDNVRGTALRVVTERLLQTLTEPINWQGEQLPINISIGVSHVPGHAGNAEELLRSADQAMYRAKSQGGGWVITNPADTSPPGDSYR